MEVLEGHRALSRSLKAPSITLGNFDGVHIGHQRLIERARRATAGDVVVYTFDPHPAKILSPKLAPPLITSRARKLELLADAGVDVTILEPFTRDLAAMEASDFHRVLQEILGAQHLVVGYDFTYGKGRSGNAETLVNFGGANEIAVEVVAAVDVDGLVASSTKIREFIEEGNLLGARTLLGRPFDVDGVVIRGAGRGRTIGIPTANVESTAELLPALGVYAVALSAKGDSAPLPGVANIGFNPTFEDRDRPSLEVHLLDWQGDLYGREVRVKFIERIRPERRFPGPEALVEQIRRDIASAREALANYNPL